MIHTDEKIQNIVDRLAHELLAMERTELDQLPDYGSTNREGVSVAWWQYRLETCTHFIYISSRRFFIFFQKKFLSGVVIESNGTRRCLSSSELGEYD